MIKRPTGKIWLDTFLSRKTTDTVPNQDLQEKRIVFTGGTDGIGRIAVDRFAGMGAELCLLGRNRQKTERVADEIAATPNAGSISVIECDLSSLDSVRKAASEVLSQCPRIDYLINCAGINVYTRMLSPDGFEMNFAVNYLGPYLLTELLLDRLVATPAARILNLTSATQERARLDFADLQREANWSVFSCYAQAKLCMIMHARDLARRLIETRTGTTINCLNPGYISTNLLRDVAGLERLWLPLHRYLAAPTWVGGERIVEAALDRKYDTVSGAYIYEDVLLDPNPAALDDQNVARLMATTRAMTGLTTEETDPQ